MSEVRIASVDLPSRVDEAVEVEAAAFRRPVDRNRAGGYLRHSTYPGFAVLGAFDPEDRLVGFGYGHTDAPGQWWHEQIAPSMLRAGHAPWLDGSWVLVELHVLPEHQGRGIGTELLLALLGARGEARAMLSTDDAETPARRLYRRVGFTDLLTGFRFSSAHRPYAVMGALLPLRPSRPA